MTDSAIKNHTAFIWTVADLLRGDYEQPEYSKVLFQPSIVRRLDYVLDVALTDIEFSSGTAPRMGQHIILDFLYAKHWHGLGRLLRTIAAGGVSVHSSTEWSRFI